MAIVLVVVVWMSPCCRAGLPLELIPAGFKGEIVTNQIPNNLFDDYMVRSWTTVDGLPQNHVDYIARDRDGYLWLSTWVGLTRFNGTSFVTFNPVNTPALKSDTFSGVLTDLRGDLWASSKDGLYRIRGTKFDYFGISNGLPSADILSMTMDATGMIWLSTKLGLARFDGTNAVTFPVSGKALNTQNIQFLPDGKAVVFMTEAKAPTVQLFDLATGRYSPLPAPYSRDRDSIRRTILGPDRDGVIWFRTERAVYRLKPDGSVDKWCDVPEILWSEHVLLLCDTRGDIWMTGPDPGVLIRYSRGEVSKIDLGAVAQVTSFYNMLEEPDGMYWLGTSQGLIQLKQRAVRNYGRRSGLLNDYIFSLADLGHGRVLLGTRRWPAILNLARHEMELFVLHSPNPGFPDVNATSRSLIPNNDETFWVTDGDWGPTLVGLDGTIHRTSLTARWPRPSEQYVFYRDSVNRLWIGCQTNLYIIHDQQVECLTDHSIPGLKVNNVRVIHEMADHTIWIGREGAGISVLAADARRVLAQFTTTNGLSNDDVWTIEPGEGEDVWVGTSNGLNRIRSSRCEKLMPSGGLLEPVIHQILRDNYGYLWLTGDQGIYRLDPNEISAYFEGKAERVEILPVTRDDGLLSSETNGEQQPAGFVATNGNLWIPTISGVAIVDPSKFRSETKPARPLLERVVIDGRILYDNGPGAQGKNSLSNIISLGPGRGQLVEIQYAAPEARTRGLVSYECRLAGHDSDWRSVGGQNMAIYTSLRPGDYSFELRVANHHRQMSSRTTQLRFHIAAFAYQTWWFWSLVVAAIVGLSIYIHHQRMVVAAHIQDLERQTALVAERERIAQDMHDDLGSRLTYISILADLAKRLKEGLLLLKLDELIQAVRDASRSVEEIVWAANPRNDTVSGLITYMIQHAQNVLGAASIACRIDDAPDWPEAYLSPEKRHGVYMVFKEAVNNLVKHAKASEVHLTLRHADREARIRIADNGRGFDRSAKRKDEEDGLDNMARRMANLGGACTVASQPGLGTTVEITFAWKESA